MKRTSKQEKRALELKRRLELVRTTIRELTPTQLEQINGGYTAADYEPWCPPCYTD